GHTAGMAGDRDADSGSADVAPRGVHASDAALLDADAGYVALLKDVDAERVGRPRIAPGDRVVAHGAAARLQKAALDRKARVRRAIELGNARGDLVARQEP